MKEKPAYRQGFVYKQTVMIMHWKSIFKKMYGIVRNLSGYLTKYLTFNYEKIPCGMPAYRSFPCYKP